MSAGIAAPGCHGDRVVIDIEVKAAFFLPLITNKQELSPYSGLQICLRQVEREKGISKDDGSSV